MTRLGDIDVLRMRHEFEKLAHMRVLHQFGGAAAHQQRRHRDGLGGFDHRGLEHAMILREGSLALQDARVRMPAPAAVRVQPQVLAQAVMRARTLAVRQIFGDGVGGLCDRREPFGRARAHEVLDFCDALPIDPRRDVDQHDRCEQRPLPGALCIALGQQGGHAAERGADGDRPLAGSLTQRTRDGRCIVREVRKAVVPVRDPFTVAMTALIDRVSQRTGAREMFGGAPPGMTRLSAAVQKHHRRPVIAEHIRNQRIASRSLEHRGRGLKVLHDRSLRNARAPALNTRSPTASM